MSDDWRLSKKRKRIDVEIEKGGSIQPLEYSEEGCLSIC
jgi:hypothetical protein